MRNRRRNEIDKYKLGDVVLAPEVNYRRYTKVQEDGRFGAENFNIPASDGGRALAQGFLSSYPNPKKVQSELNDGELFAIHAEKILSWDLVLDHPKTREQLLAEVDRQLAAVEMGGAGFLKAVASHARHFIDRPWRRGRAAGPMPSSSAESPIPRQTRPQPMPARSPGAVSPPAMPHRPSS